MTDPVKSLNGKLGAHLSWAHTMDRSARTAPARAGLDAKFLAEAGGDPVRAQHLRHAHFLRLAAASAAARRRLSRAKAEVAATEAAESAEIGETA